MFYRTLPDEPQTKLDLVRFSLKVPGLARELWMVFLMALVVALFGLSIPIAVGILIDQNTTPEEGVFVDFFGTKACAGTAFVKFAHHAGAAVVPGFALWEERERRYILRFYPEIEMTGSVAEDTQRVHTVLESVIRQYPDQWLWIHRRWKTRPLGEPPLY